MTTATQQPPLKPALDFAQSILDVTNNGLELIEILRDIAQDADQKAATNDRIAAANILNDRAFGKTPRQINHHIEPDLAPGSAESDSHAILSSDTPQTDDNDVESIRESTSAKSESPRLVTQIDNALKDSIGPAPSAQNPISPSRHSGEGRNPRSGSPLGNPEGQSGASPHPQEEGEGEKNTLYPSSIHFFIQQHILAITNNGQMMRDVLLEIARAKDDPKVTSYHRRRAATFLLDRALGANPNALRNVVCPNSSSQLEPSTIDEEEPFDEEVWGEIIAELNQKIKDGKLHPDPNAPKIDISSYLPPEDYVMPPEVAAEGAAKFWAANALRLERQKQWPEIEERRRKKLAQVYPSHSEDKDSEPPDT